MNTEEWNKERKTEVVQKYKMMRTLKILNLKIVNKNYAS